jgi:hypothetical protein
MKNTSKVISALVVVSLTAIGGQSSIARDSAADIGEFNFAGDAVVLPLVKGAMHPMVVVDFGDGGQHSFIVDTGAGVNVIDISIAESQGYEVVGETEIGAPGGPQIPATIVKVPLVHVGDATIVDAEFVTMDVNAFSGGMTQGVLGVGLFHDYLVVFDLGGGHITISQDSLSAGEPGVVPYNGEDAQIEIDVDVAGMRVATHIDTGAMAGFTLPAELMASLPLKEAPVSGRKARFVGGERDIKMAQLDGNIQFAGLDYENQNIAFMSPSSGHGNIGGRILGDLVVSIDQRNHLIAFQKSGRDVIAANDNKPRRLGVQFRGMPGGSVLTIGRVDQGSLGEEAGFLAGDVLLTLNDKPTEQYGMSDLRTLFGSTEPLKFDIERDGVSKTIQIP